MTAGHSPHGFTLTFVMRGLMSGLCMFLFPSCFHVFPSQVIEAYQASGQPCPSFCYIRCAQVAAWQSKALSLHPHLWKILSQCLASLGLTSLEVSESGLNSCAGKGPGNNSLDTVCHGIGEFTCLFYWIHACVPVTGGPSDSLP